MTVTKEQIRAMLARQNALGIGPEDFKQPRELVEREKQIAAAKAAKQMALPRPSPRRSNTPLPMSKPQRGGRIPNAVDDWRSHRGFQGSNMLDTYGNPITAASMAAREQANETASAMAGPNYNETPAPPVRDRTTYVPLGKQQSMNMRTSPPRQPREPREYSSFGEFLRTMGLGK